MVIVYILTGIACFVFYLLLTIETGNIILWSLEELIAGVVISLVVALAARRFSLYNKKILNPVRWAKLVAYIVGPFFFQMAKSNVDVAIRVITGEINPGIVKISPKLHTDAGITLLANSITLTPGTLTVDVDENKNDLYIHWINVKTKHPKVEDICGNFCDWIRGITE